MGGVYGFFVFRGVGWSVRMVLVFDTIFVIRSVVDVGFKLGV